MHQSNTTIGVFIVCLKTLFRQKRYLHLLFLFLFFPIYILINRLFLFLDYLLIPNIKKTVISNPMFIMGFNRSGTTFFHKFLSKSNQFTTATAWDMILPSIVLRKLLRPLTYMLSKMRFDRIEEKDKGHEVKLDQVEEDEMLLFLHKLDSKWVTNNLVPWMIYQYKEFSRNIGIDTADNVKRNKDSFSFYKNFWKRQIFLQNNKPILSKANPFVFKIDSLLSTFPDAKIKLFDIGEHKYVKDCFEYLNKKFPDRLELVIGDSTKTVPKNKNKIYDLVHIDGGHFGDIPKKDLNNTILGA